MLHKFEHWVHLLHPRYPFDQTLERIEFLGLKKKPVKTYVKKIRMGLVSAAEKEDDFLNLDNEVSSDDDLGAGVVLEGVGVEGTSGAAEYGSDFEVPPQEQGQGMSDDEFPDDFPTLPMELEEVMGGL